jgi:hypothetical protein
VGAVFLVEHAAKKIMRQIKDNLFEFTKFSNLTIAIS